MSLVFLIDRYHYNFLNNIKKISIVNLIYILIFYINFFI